MMKPISLSLLLFILWCTNAKAQITVVNKKGTVMDVDSSKWKLTDSNIYNKNLGNVGIGTNGAANSSAALEVKATNKGLLIPRVALTGTTAAAPLSAHVAGMMVYNTATAGTPPNDVIPGFYYNDGSIWKNLKPVETTQDLKDGYVDSNYNFGLGGYRNSSSAYKPLGNLTTGFNNMAIGFEALLANSTGQNNIAIGQGALKANTTGVANTAIGGNAIHVSTTGSYNTAVGRWSLAKVTEGQNNTALGYYAGSGITTGSENTAVGYFSLNLMSIGSYNTALGRRSGFKMTTGSSNTTLGANAGYELTTGQFNTMVGTNAGNIVTTGQSNTIVGNNTALGLTTGNYNTILGAGISGLTSSLSNNIILADGEGVQRIRVLDNGNTGIGILSPAAKLSVLDSTINTYLNVAHFFGPANTTAGNNTGIRFGIANSSKNSGDIRFNYQASSSDDNRIDFGFHSIAAPRLSIKADGNVGIGTTSPSYKLHIAGQVHADSTISAPNYTATVQTTATGSSYTWNMNLGANTAWTLAAGANTLSISNAKAGMFGLIKLTNSGTSTISLPAGSKVINGGAGVVPLTQTASAVDILTFYYDGTNYWWTYGSNYN